MGRRHHGEREAHGMKRAPYLDHRENAEGDVSTRKASYASEVMLRVSWSVLNHIDGQPQHTRRGEVMLDLGLEDNPDPEFTRDDLDAITALANHADALVALVEACEALNDGRIPLGTSAATVRAALAAVHAIRSEP